MEKQIIHSVDVTLSLTYNLDFDAGRVLTSLILQDNLVIPWVFPLCDVNGQAGLVAIRFSMDTMSRLQNDLTKKDKENYTWGFKLKCLRLNENYTITAGDI